MCLFCGLDYCKLALIESLNNIKGDTFYCSGCNILFNVDKLSAHAIIESNDLLVPCKLIIPDSKDLLVPFELITHYIVKDKALVNIMPSFKSIESCLSVLNNGDISNLMEL